MLWCDNCGVVRVYARLGSLTPAERFVDCRCHSIHEHQDLRDFGDGSVLQCRMLAARLPNT